MGQFSISANNPAFQIVNGFVAICNLERFFEPCDFDFSFTGASPLNQKLVQTNRMDARHFDDIINGINRETFL